MVSRVRESCFILLDYGWTPKIHGLVIELESVYPRHLRVHQSDRSGRLNIWGFGNTTVHSCIALSPSLSLPRKSSGRRAHRRKKTKKQHIHETFEYDTDNKKGYSHWVPLGAENKEELATVTH